MELFIYNLSIKHSLQKLNLGLACIFLKILHLMIAVLFSRFNSHTYFDNSVSLLYFFNLKDLVWLLYLFLNDVSHNPKYMFSTVSTLFVTVASYTIFGVKHLFCIGQSFIHMQQLGHKPWSPESTLHR